MFYQDKSHPKWKGIILGVILLIVALLVSYSDVKESEKQDQHYCEMVRTFKQTHGREGWPDYNQIYVKSCSKNIQLK